MNVGPLKYHLLLDVLSLSFGFDPNFNLEFSWTFILGNLFKSTGSLTLTCTRVSYFFKRNSVDYVIANVKKVVLLQFCLLYFALIN